MERQLGSGEEESSNLVLLFSTLFSTFDSPMKAWQQIPRWSSWICYLLCLQNVTCSKYFSGYIEVITIWLDAVRLLITKKLPKFKYFLFIALTCSYVM